MKRKVKILVSNDLATDQRMHRIAQSLCNHGYEVEILGRQKKDTLPLRTFAFKTTRLNMFIHKGVGFYLNLNIAFILRLLFAKMQVVYCVDTDTLPAGIVLKVFRRIKLVYDAHELFPEVPELMGKTGKKKIWQVVEKLGISYCTDLCITVSGSVAGYYGNRYHKIFTVVRNCPPAGTGPQPEHTAPEYILYQGALNEGRGLEALIHAALLLEVPIKIAGTGDLDTKLKDMTRQLNVNHKVTFLGNLDPIQLKSVTEKAWLGYNLLENKGLSYYYSLSNKTFDYMHSGIPQLISPFPEYQSLNQLYGFGLETETQPEAIASAVQLLLTNPAVYGELKKGSEIAAKNCSWEPESEILLHAMDGLFGK